jgi:Cu/Zn superoxide dismutase
MKTTATLVFAISLCWAGSAAAGARVAHLTGASEVPAVETQAVGQATVITTGWGVMHNVSVGGSISDVVAAHIHCAPEGVNGPVGVTLFQGGPAGKGSLSRGPLPDPDPGNACGWADLDDVMDAIEAGNAYVNVHTLNVLSGEVRGQLR